jgi:hypothetical protein
VVKGRSGLVVSDLHRAVHTGGPEGVLPQRTFFDTFCSLTVCYFLRERSYCVLVAMVDEVRKNDTALSRLRSLVSDYGNS